MFSEAASFLVQLLIVIAISFAAYGTVRRRIGYRQLLGLTNGWVGAKGLMVCSTVAAAFIVFQYYLASGLLTAQPKYDPRIPSGVAALLIWAFLRTALCEEILFRGVVRNGFAVYLGAWPANLIQATCFTALHALIFVNNGLPRDHIGQWVLLFLSIFGLSLLLVVLNDRFGRGSIYPSWLVHGLSNFATQCLFAFLG